ncbi:serine/threonine-protein kinase PCRK1-like isoform X2 [Aristolochia californica]|uniref:serine/threonine-protein kinase PCRK1-like isoform X2 n=1 Tax=Aristolochia californica TaxID=171875 RepID=UPI0035D633C1
MKCFHFSNGEKKDDPKTAKSPSARSFTTEFMRRSGSEFNSQNVSDVSVESLGRATYPNLSQQPNNLRVFTFSDLKNATRNFSRSFLVGEGGFGCVYRGTIKSQEEPHNKIDIAVKQLNRKGVQGHKEWVTEVNLLGVVDHPNLVKLVGYCAEDDERGSQRLLIYEFMPNGSVADHLSTRSQTPLSWATRLKVALDAARGLTYLHEEMDFQIIFRDLKTSNILLDESWNSKLSDFGLARLGPGEGLSHVSTAVVGTIGYAAPEYIQTGRLTAKNDVWSYGVVLYELITGRPPVDRNRPKGEQKLLEWVKQYLSDAKRFSMIWDPRIKDQISAKSAQKLAALANKCLVRHPKARPKMSEVLNIVTQIVESTATGSPLPRVKISSSTDASEESKKKESGLKRRFMDLKIGERKRSVWWAFTPRLIRTW